MSEIFYSPYNAKGPLEVAYEMSLNHINKQWFYYSLCNNIFNLSKSINKQNFLTMVYYTKLALQKFFWYQFQPAMNNCFLFILIVAQYYKDFWSASSGTEKNIIVYWRPCMCFLDLIEYFFPAVVSLKTKKHYSF